jgi:hypothetical protein
MHVKTCKCQLREQYYEPRRLTQERTLKNLKSNSSPIEMVRSVKTPVIDMSILWHQKKVSSLGLTDRKYEAPPAHIERKRVCCGNHDKGDNEPYHRKSP